MPYGRGVLLRDGATKLSRPAHLMTDDVPLPPTPQIGPFAGHLQHTNDRRCFDRLRMNGRVILTHHRERGADSDMDGQDFGVWDGTGLPRRCAPRNDRWVLRRAQDERAGDPHPKPLPSRERGAESSMDEQDGQDIGPGLATGLPRRWGLFAGHRHCAYCDGREADWQWLPAEAAILAAEQPAAIGAGVHLVCLLGIPFEGDYHVLRVFALA